MHAVARSSLVGAGIGAGLMFVLDPDRGARRRALLRDKCAWAARKTRDAAGATRRDLGNRLTGVAAGTRAMFSADEADDSVMIERVRARLGRVASHPRAITVEACDGVVTLSGDVLADELSSIVSSVKSVRGVDEVCTEFTMHLSAEGIPALQGDSRRPGWWSTWVMSGWSPTAMLAAAASTAAIVVAVTARRSV